MKYSIKISLTIALAVLVSTVVFAAPMAVETADSATKVENIEQVATGELAAAYGDLTYFISDGKVTITDCNSSATSVVIPKTIEGYHVTSIGFNAFSGCSSLESVEIPNSVTIIDDYAFYDCTSLTSIEIPDSVTSIDSNAFYNCSSLESIEIPNSVTSIGFSAFYGCSSLTSIEIPYGVTSIGSYTFQNCTSLESVEIPDSVTSIGSQAFYDCSSLKSIEIPYGVTSIGYYTFYKCTSLTSVEIPNGVTSIGDYAFYNCTSLASIEIPNGVTSIGDYAFYNCTSLASIEIPDSVTSIGSYTFNRCTSLTSIEIPDSVTSIGDGAFYYCTSLESIEIPNSVTSIGSEAFRYCTSLEKATIYSKDVVFDSYVFRYCDNLTLYGYSGSTTETYARDNYIPFVFIALEGGVITSGKCGDNLTWTLYEDGTLIIEGTGDMWNWSFWSDVSWYSFINSIKNVVIENGVTSIGNYAFSQCTRLTSIEIPSSVTSIGNSAFYNCTSLESIEIPSSVTSVGDNLFEACTSLKSISVDENNANYSSDVFGVLYNKDKTTLVQYPTGNKRTSFQIPIGVTGIGDYAFEGRMSLESIEIPDSVTSIGVYAFYRCESLESIEIPDSVTSICFGAFYSCTSLDKATIYSKDVVFDSYVFRYCDNLTLYGYSGSTTETYAKNNSIPFVALKEEIIIDLGARDDESNIRYAEIGGIQTKIDENNDKYYVEAGEENLLVEMVEKTAEGEFVKSRYFYVDMTSKTATKLDMDSYMTTDGKKSIRTSDPMGIRYRSFIITCSKFEQDEFVIDEYGFIIANAETLGDEELTFDFHKYASGVAYNKNDGTDVQFDSNDDEIVFTAVLKNLAVSKYKTDFVCKTYTKITVGGEQFVVYGEPVVGNVYDTAKEILADTTITAEMRNSLSKIILDYDNEAGFPGDEL